MSDLEYVALAYGVIWLGLLGYLIRISFRQERLQSEIRFLEQMLGDPKQIIEDADELQPSLR